MSTNHTEFNADNLRFNPPRFQTEQLYSFLNQEYGIRGELDHLAGERDQNLLLKSTDGSRYVVKIAGPDENFETVDFQIKALLHLENTDPGLSVPRQIKNNEGAQASVLADANGKPHWLRLVSFVDGDPMNEYDFLDFAAIEAIGRIAGRMCAALKDFDHPAASNFMPWDALNGIIFSDQLRQDYLPDSIKETAEAHLARLQTDSMPKLLSLPHQVIHHDAHPGNVLCAPGNPADVVGVIDFGDLLTRPVIMDVSVALASTLRHNNDVLGAASAMLTGYCQNLTFTEWELSLLYDALCASSIMTVQLLNYRARNHADDPEKIRQENFSGALDNARRFLEFDRAEFSDHVQTYAER